MKDMTFEEWMEAVDRFLIARGFPESGDLPDVCYRDMYDDGEPAVAAARLAIAYATGEE